MFVFFVVYDWNRTAAFASLLLSSGVICLPLMPLFNTLLSRMGPQAAVRRGFRWRSRLIGFDFVAVAMSVRLSESSWTLLAVMGSLLFFVFRSLYGFLPWAMFPYISDVDQVMTGRYRPATYSGIQACLRQTCSGLSNILVGMILMWAGFDSRRPWQPQSARAALAVLMFGWVSVSLVMCWLICRTLTLDRHTDGIVLEEIDRVRAGGDPSDVAPVDRDVIESLIGHPYCRVSPSR
ncbi:MFS transporter [Bifidobacterium bombi]|uniref:MFS transporter n=1 Tax=Bifidobacterium bombi TaxID=471511 RepID=UPI0039BF61D8